VATTSWEITHSVEASVSPAFAWQYWTDVANQELLQWLIRAVTPPTAATIEISLDGAILSFEWRFVGLAQGRTLLTQRIALKGEKADMYISQVKAAFTANPPVAMNKLAAAMANADPSRKSPTPD
jgi:hypothetical protein